MAEHRRILWNSEALFAGGARGHGRAGGDGLLSRVVAARPSGRKPHPASQHPASTAGDALSEIMVEACRQDTRSEAHELVRMLRTGELGVDRALE